MAILNIEKYTDFIEVSSDQTYSIEQSGVGLVDDLTFAFQMFFNEFASVIKRENWDHFAVEFWFDSGHLYLFPEKKLDEMHTEYDPFPADRLDPYLVLCLTSYLKKYDIFIEHDYGKLSDSEFEDWHLENCREVFNSVSLALSDNKLTLFVLNSLNRINIAFLYFGTSRELEYGQKIMMPKDDL
jgi:hypothetical protein